jgi:hypothetical protein
MPPLSQARCRWQVVWPPTHQSSHLSSVHHYQVPLCASSPHAPKPAQYPSCEATMVACAGHRLRDLPWEGAQKQREKAVKKNKTPSTIRV